MSLRNNRWRFMIGTKSDKPEFVLGLVTYSTDESGQHTIESNSIVIRTEQSKCTI